MKIGASTLVTFKDGLENGLGFYEDNDIEYVELLHDYPSREMDIEAILSFDLKYTIHSPIIDMNISSLNPSIREASINEVKYSFEKANELDVDTVVVHPGKIPFLGQGLEEKINQINKASMIELAETADELGVTAVFENMPNIPGFTFTRLEELTEFLEEYNMAMCLDIGHANTNGYKAEEMYSPLIKHIHVHDNLGDDDSHLSIGEGTVDFDTLISSFEANHYDGIYMIEVNQKESIIKSLEYLRNFKS